MGLENDLLDLSDLIPARAHGTVVLPATTAAYKDPPPMADDTENSPAGTNAGITAVPEGKKDRQGRRLFKLYLNGRPVIEQGVHVGVWARSAERAVAVHVSRDELPTTARFTREQRDKIDWLKEDLYDACSGPVRRRVSTSDVLRVALDELYARRQKARKRKG